MRDDEYNSVFPRSSKPIFSFTGLQAIATDAPSPLPSTNECGLDVLRDKIFGGSDTEDFPWVALIQYYRFRTDRYTFDCGGTLISKRFALKFFLDFVYII